LKSGSLILLEPSGLVQACPRIALHSTKGKLKECEHCSEYKERNVHRLTVDRGLGTLAVESIQCRKEANIKVGNFSTVDSNLMKPFLLRLFSMKCFDIEFSVSVSYQEIGCGWMTAELLG
jgi:hypothetical protein